MSLKKIWFSYVLWFIFTGLTVLITYFTLSEVFLNLFGEISLSFAGWSVNADIGFMLLTAGLAAGLCFLLHYICGRVKRPVMSKWAVRAFHILMFLGITVVFIAVRLPLVMNAAATELSEQAAYFYQASMVGAEETADLTASILEQAYSNVLSGLFLFLGNKAEVLRYFQLFLQAVSFILLIPIGWTLQKGVYAWIPAAFYAAMPFSFYAVKDAGPANFWMCLLIIGIFIICMLESAWKNKNITYIVLVAAELLFGAFVFYSKSGVLLYGQAPFQSGGMIPVPRDILTMEMLAAVVLLIFYCVSFWFHKQDHKSLFVLPFAGFYALFMWLSPYEFDIPYFLIMSAALNFYILTAESMRAILAVKPVADTGRTDSSKPAKISEEQQKEKEPENPQKEEQAPVDRRALIENVLPMPKKHVPKTLDYAFEPSEEQMHYDIEIENDDYDY